MPNIFGKIYISNPKGNAQTKISQKLGRSKTHEPWNILSLTVHITLKLTQAHTSRVSAPVETVQCNRKGSKYTHLRTESQSWMVLMLLGISL